MPSKANLWPSLTSSWSFCLDGTTGLKTRGWYAGLALDSCSSVFAFWDGKLSSLKRKWVSFLGSKLYEICMWWATISSFMGCWLKLSGYGFGLTKEPAAWGTKGLLGGCYPLLANHSLRLTVILMVFLTGGSSSLPSSFFSSSTGGFLIFGAPFSTAGFLPGNSIWYYTLYVLWILNHTNNWFRIQNGTYERCMGCSTVPEPRTG